MKLLLSLSLVLNIAVAVGWWNGRIYVYDYDDLALKVAFSRVVTR